MNNIEEEIPSTIARLLAKQRDDDPTPPTAPGQSMPIGRDYSPLERSSGH